MNMKYTRAQIEELAKKEDARVGLPIGTTASIIAAETGWQKRFLDNPADFHYKTGAKGEKPKSSARGLGGILSGTGRDPGYGVKPIGDDWSVGNQVRFIADYAKAQVKRTGSLEAGLGAYGEGPKYAQKVLKGVGWMPAWNGAEQAKTVVPPVVGTQVPQQAMNAPMPVNAPVKELPPLQLYSSQVNDRLAELNKLLGSVSQQPTEQAVPEQPVANTPSSFMNMFGFNQQPTVSELRSFGLF
jgi:hypothetical protein